MVILEDMLNHQWRPPILWVEWFRNFQFTDIKNLVLEDEDFCTTQSARLFQTAIDLGYEIFESRLPLRRKRGCQNKYWSMDLLLIDRSHVQSWIQRTKTDIQNLASEYEIVTYKQ